ncbi:hypothetical protein HME9302_02154 [Alteripontixanthobacter maritimus]|uniref:Helix-hairpin-helix domain-containing protein n=1 Tax=Alteripontixanthobacter maritimus TaxID=2161824 RepID=A0A369QCH3_9SPHN|nr:helix-hairpin-helix domain-containing protein [Alteripontixanthobacter maritimus]RDC60937.1 hypothetical protein HME9302_02154 [Alteripontixanthobacter maritimus]
MRNIFLTAAIAGTALTLSACSETAEPVTEPTAEEAAADSGSVETMVADDAVLDASTATAEQLSAIEGVSPELAAAIVAAQPFANVTELNAAVTQNVSGDAAGNILERVFVPVNLNSATREEIALIPGMTDRMIGEFLEYRPYADMAAFDREIGKYVDADEVARFRKYVTL